ncbi:hypothetical protein J3A98_003411 [Pseudomonas sp. BP6]|nr:hypothetical protein [Pseudomonas sp. BP6]MBP2288311.1 hypothetical protein [Pseudomonas sp. BP7]
MQLLRSAGFLIVDKTQKDMELSSGSPTYLSDNLSRVLSCT